MRTRRKLWNYGMIAAIGVSALVVQTTVLNNFPVHGIYCDLPLTIIIVWGAVFGSPMPPITPDELRLSSLNQVFIRQAASGSVAGALMGMYFAVLKAPIIGMIPIYYPFAGWMAGYFCLRNINKQNYLSIPLVFAITLLAETLMAWQLSLMGRDLVFDRLMQIAVPEAILNMVIAPFIYFPLRRWYDFSQAVKVPAEI